MDLRAKLVRTTELIEAVGLERLPHGTTRHLEGKLWEIRVKASGISRAIYLVAARQRVVIVRVFVKKTQKAPHRELDLARLRAKEVV